VHGSDALSRAAHAAVRKQKMTDHIDIAYMIEPSFDEAKRFEVSVAWDDMAKEYRVHVLKRYGHRDRTFPASRFSTLKQMVANLRLPHCVPALMGFDGTTYRLYIGRGAEVIYSWWAELPEDWHALRPIVDEMLQVAEET